jgi:hypothetical protein
MVGAIADGDRHTHAISSDAADCRQLRRGNQQTFATSPGDGEVTLFGWSLSLQAAGPSQAFCCCKEVVDLTYRFMTLDWDGQTNTGESS